jgi:vitamin B12 transporter
MTRLFYSTSLAALALAGAASAQSAPPTPADQATTNVKGIVVVATRTPVEKIDLANSVTVITARDIAIKQNQTLPDVLADAPGLNVVQVGGPGGVTSVYLRGTNPNHVKVLVDGIDVSDPSSTSGAFDFGQFLTADIDRVEILRGPQSGLYGSDAVGGVISVTTKSGEGPTHVTADLEGGSFATFNQNGSVSGSTGPFHYVATIEHVHTGATPVTPDDALAPGEARNDDTYDNVTASTKLGYDVTNNFDLGLVARFTDSHLKTTSDDDFYPYAYPDPVQSDQHDQQFYLRGTGHLSLLDGRFEQSLGVAYSDLQSTDYVPNDYGGQTYFDYNGDRVKVDWQGVLKLAATETLVLGAEDQHDEMSQPISASLNIASGYAELESNLFKDFNSSLNVRYDSNSRFGGHATFRVAPTYYIEATGTKLEASVGSGFKAPSLSDMFQSFPPYYGNPNLQPEKSTGYDIGFEQYLLNRRVQFGATYYYIHITDLIEYAPLAAGVPPCPEESFGCYQESNVEKAHTEGVESFLLVQPIQAVSVRLDYTYTDAVDDILHEQLLRRPHNKWSVDARWQATQQLSLDLNLVSVSSWIDGNRDFSISRLAAPGWTTMNLSASYDVTRQLTIYGRITNIGDERYEDPYGFQRPGRGFFIGAKAKL